MRKTIIGFTAYMLYGLSVSAQNTLGGLYQVITSTSDFAAGDSIILVSYDAEKNMYAMGTYDSDTGNAFHAINIGTTTADYLPSTISLDAANTSGNTYEYRAMIYKDGTIGPKDVNNEYVSSDNRDDNTNLFLDDEVKKWSPINLHDVNSSLYRYNGVSLRLGDNKVIGFSLVSDCFQKKKLGTSNYTLAYCYKKVATHQVFSLGSTGYATMYYSSNDVELPSELTAYTVNVTKDAGSYRLHLNNIGTSVPHGTAVLISGEANTDYYLTIYTTTATTANEWSAVEGNMLHGTDADALQSNGEGYYFKLADHATKGVGFYWGAEDGAPFTNKAHKAYLFLPEELISASLSDIPFSLIEGGSTLVRITKKDYNTHADLPLYNAAGQKMRAIRRDVMCITDGKKIMKK